MKKYTVTTYSFDELSQEAQEAALSELCDINVDYDWWRYSYDDAENIGVKITSFDMDRYCNMDFDSALSIAEKIVKEHGEMCDTYKTAVKYITEYAKLVTEQEQEQLEDLDNEFKKSLEEDYRILLAKEYDYLTSDEAIKESIEANNYEFLSTGKRY
jgi:DNA-directed RNA polymerase subunit F